MPFMLVGTGPLGSGTWARWASSALSRLEEVGHARRASPGGRASARGAPAWAAAPGPRRCRRRPRARGSRRRPARACLRSLAISWLQPVGVALADQHDARRADDAVHHVLLLGEADDLVDLPAAPQHLSARAPAPAWPSIWAYAAFCARRLKTIIMPRKPSSSAPTIDMTRPRAPAAGQHPEEAEADAAEEQERARASTTARRGRPPWSSCRSR